MRHRAERRTVDWRRMVSKPTHFTVRHNKKDATNPTFHPNPTQLNPRTCISICRVAALQPPTPHPTLVSKPMHSLVHLYLVQLQLARRPQDVPGSTQPSLPLYTRPCQPLTAYYMMPCMHPPHHRN